VSAASHSGYNPNVASVRSIIVCDTPNPGLTDCARGLDVHDDAELHVNQIVSVVRVFWTVELLI
jgi:hypothetical protein